MAAVAEGLDKKKPRRRPGRKERRRRRQNAESNNKDPESVGNRNAGTLGILAVAGSPVKFWLQQHSEDVVPDEICEYISSILSDKSVTSEKDL